MEAKLSDSFLPMSYIKWVMTWLCPGELITGLSDPTLWSGSCCRTTVWQWWLGTATAEEEGKTKQLFHWYLCQLSSHWADYCSCPAPKSLSEQPSLTNIFNGNRGSSRCTNIQLLHEMVYYLEAWLTGDTAQRTSFLEHNVRVKQVCGGHRESENRICQ